MSRGGEEQEKQEQQGQRVRQDLSSDEIQRMVEQEAERVARELAEEPSSSLLALSDARRQMDDMAMKAQVTALVPGIKYGSWQNNKISVRRVTGR